jgi:hypothetical protein
MQADHLEDAGEVDMVLDVIGGDMLDRSTALVRAGGTLVTITAPPKVRSKDGRAIFFVVEPDRARLADLAHRVRDGRLKPIVGAVRPLAEAAAAFARPAHRRQDDHPGRRRLKRRAIMTGTRHAAAGQALSGSTARAPARGTSGSSAAASEDLPAGSS